MIKPSSVHGLGVFASTPIFKDETIEVSRLLKMAWRSKYNMDQTIRDYCWNQVCSCLECKTHGYNLYLALGFGSIYNHADVPNTISTFDYSKLTLIITAKEDIAAGQEIFVTYGANYWKNRSKFLTPPISTV